MRVLRENGKPTALVLSCGHELSLKGRPRLPYAEERYCKECTEAEEKLWHGNQN